MEHAMTSVFSRIMVLMFALVVPLLSGCTAMTMAVAEGREFTLSEQGTTNYSIVIARDAAPPVSKAAMELALFLNEATGATFEVKQDDVPASPFEIVLGETNHKTLADIDSSLHPSAWEGFVIVPEQESLYIMGGRISRGTLYGVYDFLEQEIGVRFLAPEVNHIPHHPTLTVRVAPRFYDPPFEYRGHYPPNTQRPGYGLWANRSRVNSFGVGSGHVRRLGHPVHTFAVLVPVDKHFAAHPEYFALIDGKRVASTLCLTNPGTLKVALETAGNWAESAANDPGVKNIVQISQNDSGAYCQCKGCAAVNEEEGVPMTGTLIRFLNGVARGIARDHPRVFVETLAYMTAEVAPTKTRADPNVIIWMAPIMKDSSRMLTEPQGSYGRGLGDLSQRTSHLPDHLNNRASYENLKGWLQASQCVYIWDYPQSFHDFLVPYPSLWANAANIRLFAEHGVKGYFPQQPNTDGSEMRYLRNYMLTRLQWRPQADARELVEEFCHLYYGRGAGVEAFAHSGIRRSG